MRRVDAGGVDDWQLYGGDCLDVMRDMPDGRYDMVMGSPPYEDARRYGPLGFTLRGEAWVEWALPRYLECLRVCRGLVCWVVSGRTQRYRYSPAVEMLMARLHGLGVHLRRPPLYVRWGIPGSGGPDWFANRYEYMLCAAPPGRLPWSDPTATGQPPKCPPGGKPSSRTKSGARVRGKAYRPPRLANPGNIIDCGAVGGGRMGSPHAHRSVAPYPEKLVEVMVRSFCPPGGTVLDPFAGSGTTGAVACRLGRSAVMIEADPAMQPVIVERMAGGRDQGSAIVDRGKK